MPPVINPGGFFTFGFLQRRRIWANGKRHSIDNIWVSLHNVFKTYMRVRMMYMNMKEPADCIWNKDMSRNLDATKHPEYFRRMSIITIRCLAES